MKRFISVCLAAAFLAVPFAASAQTPQEILARFSNEPTIEDTMNAAIEYAGLDVDRYESMYDRAAGAYALPKVLSYEVTYRDQDRDRPQSYLTYEDGKMETENDWTSYRITKYREDTDYIQHKGRLQWDLSKLVYNSDQLRVASQMNSAADKRDNMLKSVSKTYYERRRKQIEQMTNPPKDTTKQLQLQLKIDELTATLNVLTGGWFVKNIGR